MLSPPRVSPGRARCCPYILLTACSHVLAFKRAHSWFLAELNWKLEEAQLCPDAGGHIEKGFFYVLLISSGTTTTILGVSLNPESGCLWGGDVCESLEILHMCT